jgi:hypothetical protein
MTIIYSSDGNDALSQDKTVIVSAEPLIEWEILGDLTSIEIIFSNNASTFNTESSTVNDDQLETDQSDLESDPAVSNDVNSENTLFSAEEIMLRFESYDSLGFGFSGQC